ncbi:NAD(P)-dependent dehydrogenase (short-subunit alcohol dehydrogenase family) [Paraburkholderia atlantica]
MLMKGKVGLVTGGGSGMGRAAALELAKEGAVVVLCGRTADKLSQVRQEIQQLGGQAEIFLGDVSKREDNQSLVNYVEERFGRLDFAFNNAGGHGDFHPIHETSIEEAEWVIDLNFKGVYYGVKFQIEAMLRCGGGVDPQQCLDLRHPRYEWHCPLRGRQTRSCGPHEGGGERICEFQYSHQRSVSWCYGDPELYAQHGWGRSSSGQHDSDGADRPTARSRQSGSFPRFGPVELCDGIDAQR